MYLFGISAEEIDAGSSNGRTEAFGAFNVGSIPTPAALRRFRSSGSTTLMLKRRRH